MILHAYGRGSPLYSIVISCIYRRCGAGNRNMKTAVWISLLVVGLAIGIAASFALSIGAVVAPKTSVVVETSIVSSTAVVTSTATVQTMMVAGTPRAQSLSRSTTESSVVTSTASQSTTSSSATSTSSSSNVTISGPVSVSELGATPYKVTLFTSASGELSFPVAGGQEITASVPNNEEYNPVVIYFYTSSGGSSSCDSPQPLYVYSQTPVYAVDISC